ncbi:MAG: DUF4352 domain-containing protein [Bacillaceae bacterium]|nr:DUF4352 domain-containing protein [Bacillaceae bacterium]
MKKLKVFGIALLMMGFVLVGCEESEVSKVEKVTEETSDVVVEESTGANEVEETITDLDLTIGDTVAFDGLQVTLNSVHKSMGKEFFEPTNAYYVILNVTIENTTDKSEHISSLLNFKLIDGDGYSQDIGLFADTKGSLDGEIGAGRSMRGEIAFDAYESNAYEFIFENPFTSGQAIFTFDASEID